MKKVQKTANDKVTISSKALVILVEKSVRGKQLFKDKVDNAKQMLKDKKDFVPLATK